MDVIAAYLNGKLDKEVYIKQPPRFNNVTAQVCKLVLSIYGLKQASRNWNIELDTAFDSYSWLLTNVYMFVVILPLVYPLLLQFMLMI